MGGTKGAPGGGAAAWLHARHPPETRSFKKWIESGGGGEEENRLRFRCDRQREGEIVRKYFGGEPLPVWGKFLREEGAN